VKQNQRLSPKLAMNADFLFTDLVQRVTAGVLIGTIVRGCSNIQVLNHFYISECN